MKRHDEEKAYIPHKVHDNQVDSRREQRKVKGERGNVFLIGKIPSELPPEIQIMISKRGG